MSDTGRTYRHPANYRPSQCECYDAACHYDTRENPARCSAISRLRTLYRVDMDDTTGTRMCETCGADALESGLFDTRAPRKGGR